MYKDESGNILLDGYTVELVLSKKGLASIVRNDWTAISGDVEVKSFDFISFDDEIQLDTSDTYYSSKADFFGKEARDCEMWSLTLNREEGKRGTLPKITFTVDKFFNNYSRYFVFIKKSILLSGKLERTLEEEVAYVNTYLSGNVYSILCDELEKEFEDKDEDIPVCIGNDISKNGVLTLLGGIYLNFSNVGGGSFVESFKQMEKTKEYLYSPDIIIDLLEDDFAIEDFGSVVNISDGVSEEVFSKENLFEEIFDTSFSNPLREKIKLKLVECYKNLFPSII